jgi:hypothetical protein
VDRQRSSPVLRTRTLSIASWLIFARKNKAALPYRTWCHPPEHPLGQYLCSQDANPQSQISKDATENSWHGRLRAIDQEWTDMHCAITSANNFSGQSVVISRISPVQSAASLRKSNLNRPFIFPILPSSLFISGKLMFT